MREEAENWWKQAERDLESAQNSLESDDYYVAVFLSQQAVEKAFKALYIYKKAELPPASHSLIYLASLLKTPQRFFSTLRRLNPEFITTRYPDAANGLPYEMYDETIASQTIADAEGVLNWIENQMTTQ